MRKRYLDIFVIGFALFSMFFGAGNIIFPPYIGMGAGSQWGLAFFCYYIADIGLAIFAIFTLIRQQGDVDAITGRIGKLPGQVVMSAVILCIGPLIALPRTGATTYEMFFVPVFGDVGSTIPVIIFFGIILLLSIRESSVIDILGKFLTPILFIGLIVLIICGIISPLGPISQTPMIDNVVVEGINAGYQTMDVMAALAFGIVIVKTVTAKGYTDKKVKYGIVYGSSIVAAIGLFAVYGGLTYLGATASTLYDININRSELIINIVGKLMGYPGIVILGIVVTLACITTAVALVTACAEYFSDLSKGRLKYEHLAIVTCVVSAGIATFGIDQIVSLASPVLSLIYPGMLMLIILSFCLPKTCGKAPFIGGVLGASVISLCEIAYGWGAPLEFVTKLPLASLGFSWIVPALICTVIASLIGYFKQKNT